MVALWGVNLASRTVSQNFLLCSFLVRMSHRGNLFAWSGGQKWSTRHVRLCNGRLGWLLCTSHTLTLIYWLTSMPWTAAPRLQLDAFPASLAPGPAECTAPWWRMQLHPHSTRLAQLGRGRLTIGSRLSPRGPAQACCFHLRLAGPSLALLSLTFYLSFLTAYIADFKVQKQM